MLRKLFGMNTESETIIWARLQVIGGALIVGINEAGIAPLLTAVGLPRWVPVGLMVMGFVTEALRRHRATDLK